MHSNMQTKLVRQVNNIVACNFTQQVIKYLTFVATIFIFDVGKLIFTSKLIYVSRKLTIEVRKLILIYTLVGTNPRSVSLYLI